MRRPLLCLVLLAAGCDTEPSLLPAPEEPPAAPPAASSFDPARCGRVEGRVTWQGELPADAGFLYGMPKADGNFEVRLMPNPNRPAVDPATRAVAGAVVFLRGVSPAAAKPWDLPPVRVEMRDRQVVVRQGEGPPRRAGFVRRGDAVTMLSAEPVYHVLRARGAAFFSLTFPEPEQALTRTLERAGRVELTSGAGYYWANADLFVDDHPYYSLTDPEGRFALEQVPAGNVELVVWLPGWNVARQERDPESGLIIRQTYTPPTERTRKVTVTPGGSATADTTVP